MCQIWILDHFTVHFSSVNVKSRLLCLEGKRKTSTFYRGQDRKHQNLLASSPLYDGEKDCLKSIFNRSIFVRPLKCFMFDCSHHLPIIKTVTWITQNKIHGYSHLKKKGIFFTPPPAKLQKSPSLIRLVRNLPPPLHALNQSHTQRDAKTTLHGCMLQIAPHSSPLISSLHLKYKNEN